MSQAQIGERVRHIRDYYGWSQAQLAAMAGISQPAIHQIEQGGGASPSTVDAIAKASGFSAEFLERGPLPDLPNGSIRYRKTSRARVRDDKRIRAQVRHTLEALEILADKAKPPPVRLRVVDGDEDVTDDTIEEVAFEAREWMGIGSMDPIPNVTRALERAGVVVIRSNDEVPGHDGISYWLNCPVGTPIIWTSRGLSGDRHRLTVGHEAGHLVLHQLRNVDQKRAEKEAYRFAGALLMPKGAVEEIDTPVTLRRLAETKARWGVAISALARRCLDVGVIDQERYVSLMKQISSRGWRKTEPVEVPGEDPVLLQRLMTQVIGSSDPRSVARPIGIAPIAARELVV